MASLVSEPSVGSDHFVIRFGEGEESLPEPEYVKEDVHG
jgi:hypothetical protein